MNTSFHFVEVDTSILAGYLLVHIWEYQSLARHTPFFVHFRLCEHAKILNKFLSNNFVEKICPEKLSEFFARSQICVDKHPPQPGGLHPEWPAHPIESLQVIGNPRMAIHIKFAAQLKARSGIDYVVVWIGANALRMNFQGIWKWTIVFFYRLYIPIGRTQKKCGRGIFWEVVASRFRPLEILANFRLLP